MAELFEVNSPIRKPLFEGVQGENEARSIQFDIEPWVTELGDGAVTATAKRSQDSQPYPVTVTKDGTTVTWKPTSTDTAFAGVGSFQLEYTVDDVLAKTCIWSTMVAPSLDPAGDPPDPYDNWLAEMREIAADAIQAAQDADESADDAQAEVYEAEAWAKGTKNGAPVSSTDAQYQNNSKYFAEESYKNAEAWAVGQRGGVDVPSTDPTYENNAKYWAGQSLANQYGAYIVKSASGDIASFADGADDVPMKSVNVTITPKQSGSGDPSPSNVRPITGTSTANVTVAGKNLWDKSDTGTFINTAMIDSGAIASRSDSRCIFVPCAPNTTYTASKTRFQTNTRFAIGWAKEKPAIGVSVFDVVSAIYSGTVGALATVTTTTGADAKYIVVWASWDVASLWAQEKETIQIEEGSAATAYVPYTGTTTPVPLGQTVYGGEVNPISGELVIDRAMVSSADCTYSVYSSATARMTIIIPNGAPNVKSTYAPGEMPNIICDKLKTQSKNGLLTSDYTISQSDAGNSRFMICHIKSDVNSVEAMQTWAGNNPFTIVYEIATPTTVQLTPTQIATLLGTNNVWSDAGSVEVEYRADPTLAYNELANVIVSLGGNL